MWFGPMGHKDHGGPSQLTHPHCLLIVVFTAQGLATANVIVAVAANGFPTTPTTAAKDDSIKVAMGG